ncbi:MAG: glycosyltransferase [Zetaproteobacteria bacterium]|nr:glycosyltransferase [Zetaproteobacteria bacterium]
MKDKSLEPKFKYLELEEYDTRETCHESISAFHNAFQGKRCFIIGNGPSLNEVDFHKLRGEFTFAVNSFFYKTRETGFRPTFYVVEDSFVMKDNRTEINGYHPTLHRFFPTNYIDMIDDRRNTSFFRLNRGFYEKTSPNYGVPRFSTDAAYKLYCGQSVTYINLQLAYYMGFTEVYLVGMDFNYIIPSSAKVDGVNITSTEDDPNHFHPEYFGKGKRWHDPQLPRVLANYKMAKTIYELDHRTIWNATHGGKLEEFPRCDFNEIAFQDTQTETQPIQGGIAHLSALAADNSTQYRAFAVSCKPQISIGIPLYNEPHYIGECLESLRSQTFTDFEVIIVNDAATDHSPQIAQTFCQQDPRFRIISHSTNKGLPAARNTALKHAKADYITFLDADDYLTPQSLYYRFKEIKSIPADGAGTYCGMLIGYRNLKPEDYQNKADQRGHHVVIDYIRSKGECPFNAHAPLLRAALIKEAGGFDESMKYGAEDWDLWIRLLRNGYRFFPVKRYGAVYRQKKTSMVRELYHPHFKESLRILQSASSSAPPEIKMHNAPFFYEKPLWHYQQSIQKAKRILRYACTAILNGEQDQSYAILKALEPNSWNYLQHHIDLPWEVRMSTAKHLAVDMQTRENSMQTNSESAIAQIHQQLNTHYT